MNDSHSPSIPFSTHDFVGAKVGAVLAVVLPALRQRMDRLHPEAAARAKELLQATEN